MKSTKPGAKLQGPPSRSLRQGTCSAPFLKDIGLRVVFSGSLQHSVHGRSGHREHSAEVRDAVVFDIVHPVQFVLLHLRQPRLASLQFALRSLDGHAFQVAHAEEADLELSRGGEDEQDQPQPRSSLPPVTRFRRATPNEPGGCRLLVMRERGRQADECNVVVECGELEVIAGEPVDDNTSLYVIGLD